MFFNSYVFILAFFPICVAVYYFLNRARNMQLGNLWLLIMSVVFYTMYSTVGAIIIFICIILNYASYRLIRASHPKRSIHIKRITVAFNIFVLFAFKYAVTTVTAINGFAGTSFVLDQVIVPIGLSFITFSQISFICDSSLALGDCVKPWEYALYALFFPKVLSGPIMSASELIPQFRDGARKKVNYHNLSVGLFSFSIGLAKKVLIADWLASLVDICYSDAAVCTGYEAVAAMLAFSLQLYFDFSGYSDMAIGVGKMLNIDITQNFNSPYKSVDIIDFWKRWHMTLTTFLTKYIYYPLGGNRRGKPRQYTNILIVFVISGMWHGAGLTFVVWGLLHGVANLLTRSIKPILRHQYRIPSVICTFLLVTLFWVFFRAGTISDAYNMLSRLFCAEFGFLRPLISQTLMQPALFGFVCKLIPIKLALPLVFALLLVIVFFCKNSSRLMADFKPTFARFAACTLLLTVSILSITGLTTFIYGGF